MEKKINPVTTTTKPLRMSMRAGTAKQERRDNQARAEVADHIVNKKTIRKFECIGGGHRWQEGPGRIRGGLTFVFDGQEYGPYCIRCIASLAKFGVLDRTFNKFRQV